MSTNSINATFFATQALFRKWLEKNHKKEKELIVGYYKVDSGKASMTWSQSVDEALCFGWIDSQAKSLDEDSYLRKFTPRRDKSNWSKRNKEHFARLLKDCLLYTSRCV